ncbi:YhgE/Pip domain-containing protein [Paenibacillus sp. R14(2021)]|uniref:YhgE/Pip domain-containing protein n=1 Tax=Paenibacillus sp. R14(2021) TaxID=2859228 RepID=UPI001C612B0B|nr:ABC transporter permease [Paenibacillus sp. R14(2021)]
MALFRQKMLWIGLVRIVVVMMVLGLAMMGSVLGAKPKDLPVALVVEDKAVTLPDGSMLNIGAMVKEKLLANTALPFVWHEVATEADARAGLDQQDYYGAFIIPADLSKGIASFMTEVPKPATVKVIGNEGMNTQAATAVKQVLGQVSRMLSAELTGQLLSQVEAESPVIPISAAKAIMSPFMVVEETVHPVGLNNASGSAPGMLTQIMWIGSLVISVILALSAQKVKSSGVRRMGVYAMQLVMGAIFVVLVSGYLVWMAHDWYGMAIVDQATTWVALLSGIAFFAIQSMLLNWLGLPAVPILILLMFFSLPVMNIAPEFLPQTTQDWLYSWTPFRFAAASLRNAMYYDEVSVTSSNTVVLWLMVGIGAVLLLLSALKPQRARGQGSAV